MEKQEIINIYHNILGLKRVDYCFGSSSYGLKFTFSFGIHNVLLNNNIEQRQYLKLFDSLIN